jgi:hypothetical protein
MGRPRARSPGAPVDPNPFCPTRRAESASPTQRSHWMLTAASWRCGSTTPPISAPTCRNMAPTRPRAAGPLCRQVPTGSPRWICASRRGFVPDQKRYTIPSQVVVKTAGAHRWRQLIDARRRLVWPFPTICCRKAAQERGRATPARWPRARHADCVGRTRRRNC